MYSSPFICRWNDTEWQCPAAQFPKSHYSSSVPGPRQTSPGKSQKIQSQPPVQTEEAESCGLIQLAGNSNMQWETQQPSAVVPLEGLTHKETCSSWKTELQKVWKPKHMKVLQKILKWHIVKILCVYFKHFCAIFPFLGKLSEVSCAVCFTQVCSHVLCSILKAIL